MRLRPLLRPFFAMSFHRSPRFAAGREFSFSIRRYRHEQSNSCLEMPNLAVADTVEARHAIIAAGDRLAVDGAGAGAQPGQRLGDQREAVHQVVPQAAVEPHPCAVLSGDDAEAVVLDFVQPLAAGRQLVGLLWEGTAR
jgi:hypothetical protein